MRKLLLASAASLLAAGAAFAQPATQVAAPGTVAVHLHGYFQYSVGGFGSSNMGSDAAGYKLNGYGTAGDFRLYPGFDGQTLNGIWYGAQIELRTATTAASGSGVGSSSSSGFGGLYVRRAYGYIGMPEYGFARFGQTDSAFTLSQVGVVEDFGDGGHFNNDGGSASMLPTTPGLFIYADTGHLYTTNKVLYETPKFETELGNFSGIVGFEPNSNGLKQGQGGNVVNSAEGESAGSIAGGSNSRRRNTVDVSLSYADLIDGFANKASISYLNGSPLSSTNGVYASSPAAAPRGYDTLSVFQGGLQTTYAGLTVGGNIKFGQVEDGYNFKPKGARDAFGYIVGASYNNGPYTLGVAYFNEQSSGKFQPGAQGQYARTLSEYGISTGANYQLAKPISLFIEYDYGHQHQPAASAATNTQEQVVAVGTTLKW